MINKIYSLDKLKDYILRKLGSPVVNVELTDDQLTDAIDDALIKFTEVAMEGQLEKVLLLDVVEGTREYKIDEKIRSIVEVATGSSSGTFSNFQVHGMMVTPSEFWSQAQLQGDTDLVNMQILSSQLSLMDEMFSNAINFNFSSATNILSFTEDIGKRTDKLLLDCYSHYDLDIKNDNIFNHEWVKDYSVASALFQWGQNVGKFEGTLISGEKINYNDMKTKGAESILKLEDDLLTKWSEPMGIYR